MQKNLSEYRGAELAIMKKIFFDPKSRSHTRDDRLNLSARSGCLHCALESRHESLASEAVRCPALNTQPLGTTLSFG